MSVKAEGYVLNVPYSRRSKLLWESARASSMKTATDHCAKLGKHPLVVNTTSDSQFTQGTSDIQFRCVDQVADRCRQVHARPRTGIEAKFAT